MQRIAILGNAGSGKSWLAARLAAAHGLPIVGLDDLFWMPPGQYAIKRPAEQLMSLIEAKRLEPFWIVEGVFGELIVPFLDRADCLVWIDVPWDVSRARLEHRRGVSDAAAFERLVTYAAAYWRRDDGLSHTGHRRLFEGFARRKVHLTSEGAVNAFVADPTDSGARRAEPEDSRRLFDVRRAAILELAGRDLSAESALSWADAHPPEWMDQVLVEKCVWVWESGRCITAWVSFTGNHIDGLYTDPAFSRQGMASSLLQIAEGELLKLGANGVSLDATANAREFYLRRGYVPTGTPDGYGAVPMRKSLADEKKRVDGTRQHE